MVSWRGGRLALLCLAAGGFVLGSLPAGASEPATVWTAHALPSFPDAGCVKTAWSGGKIFAVRTPLCNLAADQTVTFLAYDPATGQTQAIADLPSAAAQATVKEIDGRLYIFTPRLPDRPAVPVHEYDPESQALRPMSSVFPGTSVDAPTFNRDGRITFTSSCVWSCSFVTYDPSRDAWTTHEARLPNNDATLAKFGLIWDGDLARILTLDQRTGQWRFFDYDPATDTVAPGSVQAISASAGPLLQTGPVTGVMAVTAAPGFVHMMQFSLTRGSWSAELGTLPAAAAPRLWGGNVAWAFHFPSGGVACVTPLPTCDLGTVAALPPAEDANGNGFADGPTDEAPQPPAEDLDMDGRSDEGDNCGTRPNPTQSDLDRDGVGDACDADADGDGVPEVSGDNCPSLANAAQADADADGVGDACEDGMVPPATPAHLVDSDGDGVADGDDNCAVRSNPGQGDLDTDGIGDPCDVDVDGDGIAQVSSVASVFLDNCPTIGNADQLDANDDGVGDACDTTLVVPPAKDDGLGTSKDAPAGSGVVVSDRPDLGTAAVTAAAGAATVGAGVALWSLRGKWLPLFGLFSRQVLVQNDMQPSRRALLAAVEAHPGIHFNELARLTQQGRGAVQHHLKILEARGSIRMVRYGRYTCVYPAQAPPTPADGVLKSEVARRLDGMVRLTPGMTAAEASRMLGVTYGAAAYHMRRMAEAGLVRLEENPLAAYPIPHGGHTGQVAASSGSGPGNGGNGTGHPDGLEP